jgi:predicted dehydrogenase
VSPLRTALVGCGHWGEKLARNLDSLPEFQLAAVCDPDRERAETLARRYGTHAEADPEILLRSVPLDAVVVATPARSHARLAAAALRTGIHVLVEKPLSMSLKDIVELIDTSVRSGRTLMTDHTEVHSGVFRTVLAEVAAGTLGTLRGAALVHHNEAPGPADLDILWDLAPHDFALLDALFGELPDSIRAVSPKREATGDAVRVEARYCGGRPARIDLSRGAGRGSRTLHLEGTEGTLRAGPFGPEGRVVFRPARAGHGSDPDEVALPFDRTEPLASVCRAFAARIRSGAVGADPGEARIPTAVEAARRAWLDGPSGAPRPTHPTPSPQP